MVSYALRHSEDLEQWDHLGHCHNTVFRLFKIKKIYWHFNNNLSLQLSKKLKHSDLLSQTECWNLICLNVCVWSDQIRCKNMAVHTSVLHTAYYTILKLVWKTHILPTWFNLVWSIQEVVSSFHLGNNNSIFNAVCVGLSELLEVYSTNESITQQKQYLVVCYSEWHTIAAHFCS